MIVRPVATPPTDLGGGHGACFAFDIGALLTALTALGCYQSYAEFADGDLDTHAAPDDAHPEVRDDGALPDLEPVDDADVGTEADADVEAEVDADAAVDADVGADAGTCAGGWYDPTSGLCWQDSPDEIRRDWDDAVAYCDGLTLGGHDEWHLPTIDELRSLIRGCPATMTGGPCGLTNACAGAGCWNEACNGCSSGGPGTDGACWPPGLGGTVYFYWSSSSYAGDASVALQVYFYFGSVGGDYRASTDFVRCVRSDP
jgi:hypothetical protein